MSKVIIKEDKTVPGVKLIERPRFSDHRGTFEEIYNVMDGACISAWDQDNISRSHAGVLRGLHFQKEYPQAKLVTCISGSILDVAVDLKTGKWTTYVLTDRKSNSLYLPNTVAHGFYVLSEFATVHYKCSEYYRPELDSGIHWKSVPWLEQVEMDKFFISKKDSELPLLWDLKF